MAQSRRPFEFDLDERYERRVKTLYSAIIEFATRASGKELPQDVIERVNELRDVAERIVRAVKDYELGSARGHGLTPVGRTTLVNHAALALFGHVRSTRGKQHLPLLPSRVASLAS